MTHVQKVDRLIVEMKQKGLSPFTVAPPLFRLFWKLGWNVKPPLFMSFVSMTLMMGIIFGVLWGVIMWLFPLHALSGSLYVAVGIPAAAGLMFGVIMAAYFRWKAKKLGLPRWNNYPEQTPGTQP